MVEQTTILDQMAISPMFDKKCFLLFTELGVGRLVVDLATWQLAEAKIDIRGIMSDVTVAIFEIYS